MAASLSAVNQRHGFIFSKADLMAARAWLLWKPWIGAVDEAWMLLRSAS